MSRARSTLPVALNAADLRLVRMALNEAIDSLRVMERSVLPPYSGNDNEKERLLRKRWRNRLKEWALLRGRLGGLRKGEGAAGPEWDAVRRSNG